MNPAFAIVECLWILSGRRDAKLVNFWNPALPRFGGHGAVYQGAYGFRLRHQFEIDQIERAYLALKSNQASRQVVLQIWNPKMDLPESDGKPTAGDVPCNICSMLKIRDGRLDWLQTMRSNDIFRGTPYNVVQFTFLQEIISGWLGADVGTYSMLVDSLHLYESDVGTMRIDGNEEPIPHRSHALALTKDHFDSLLAELMRNLDDLASADLTRDRFRQIVECSRPDGYSDLMAICAADSARRRQWTDDEQWATRLCSDEVLQIAYGRWSERMSQQS